MKKFQGTALEDVDILTSVLVAKKRLSDRYILFTIGFESVGGLKFKPGDHVNIFPENDPAFVSKVLSYLKDLPKDEITTWNGMYTYIVTNPIIIIFKCMQNVVNLFLYRM